MQNIESNRRRSRMGRAVLAVGAAALLSLAAVSAAGAGSGEWPSSKQAAHYSYGHSNRHGMRSSSQRPVRAMVLTPTAGERTRSGFNVEISLQAQNSRGNSLLSDYETLFVDPTGKGGMGNPDFHPGASQAAPGLVVTLSTTPAVKDTPLVGPSTNLAGVFQVNAVTRSNGLRRTWNDWQVTSPGFFGQNKNATLTVYAVEGTAPDAVPAGGLRPISNVVRQTFRIGS
jgi:hypothetical protein